MENPKIAETQNRSKELTVGHMNQLLQVAQDKELGKAQSGEITELKNKYERLFAMLEITILWSDR